MLTNSSIGKIGEDIAAQYLTLNKFRVLYRNYRERFGELDIVAKNKLGVLVIIEVKTLIKNSETEKALTPEDEMTVAKMTKLKRTSEFFIRKHSELIDESRGWQIDMIAIDIPLYVLTTGDPKILLPKVHIRYYENI